MPISDIIKKLRTDNALTQVEFAKKMNCNRQKIADWERGKSTPSADDIILLCEKFGVSADYIFKKELYKMTVKIKFDKDGNIKSIKAPLPDDGTTGRTRMSKAALVLWKGKIEPTTGYKLRRFFKRMAAEISARAAVFCDEESVKAVPHIGLLEGGR